MSRLNVGSFRHPDATADAITLTNGGDTQINRALGLGGATYGTSGQVLTSAGSGAVPTWTTVNTPDVPLDWPGTAIEAGAGGITQITFDGIDANAKRITLKWYHCGLSAAGVNGQLRLRAGSGGTIMTTNNYQYDISYGTSYDMTANADHIRLVSPAFTDAQHRHYGQATIENLNFSDRWTVVGNSASISHAPNPVHVFAGGFDLPGTLDRIQFYCPSSTFADGRINILVEG